ncbi:MAG: hypothetical protein NTV62_02815 [Candidatus Gribaldobacteria bacterium]|nr:hypothetical protein [Candidatus Gribaldobacteria bacterium]
MEEREFARERELEEYLKDLGFDDKKYPFAHWLVGGIQRDWTKRALDEAKTDLDFNKG